MTFLLQQRLIHKKLHWPKNILLIKKPQFCSDLAEILAILPTNELIILTKFDWDWTKIVNSLSLVYFWASIIIFLSVSRFIEKDCTWANRCNDSFLKQCCRNRLLIKQNLVVIFASLVVCFFGAPRSNDKNFGATLQIDLKSY